MVKHTMASHWSPYTSSLLLIHFSYTSHTLPHTAGPTCPLALAANCLVSAAKMYARIQTAWQTALRTACPTTRPRGKLSGLHAKLTARNPNGLANRPPNCLSNCPPSWQTVCYAKLSARTQTAWRTDSLTACPTVRPRGKLSVMPNCLLASKRLGELPSS